MTDATIFLQDPVYWIWTALVLGLTVGSFINVVIYRLPIMMQRQWQRECQQTVAPEQKPEPAERFNLLVPGSTCPGCQHRIKPWENIPVLSYLLLRGRCSHCKMAIAIRYPLIELASGLLALISAALYGPGLGSLLVMILCWMLLAMSVIDLDHQLLPDSLTLPLLWLGLLANTAGLFTHLDHAVYGAVAGYLSLWSVYWLFKLITGKEGMGYGDFKLLAALGAWMGWHYLPLIIVLSSFVGALIGLAMIVLRGRDRNIPIPFGPYLAAAGLIAMFWGDALLNTYFAMVII